MWGAGAWISMLLGWSPPPTVVTASHTGPAGGAPDNILSDEEMVRMIEVCHKENDQHLLPSQPVSLSADKPKHTSRSSGRTRNFQLKGVMYIKLNQYVWRP